MDLEAQTRAAFAENGALARHFSGYRQRPEQLEMALAVARALSQRAVLLAEAGTGTGKTLAYGVPALLSGQRVVISTATKNLQEQVALRDLPRLAEALGVRARVTLLKGRQNYLCLHRLSRMNSQGSFHFRGERHFVSEINAWAETTETGDRAELAALSEDFAGWRELDARSESCLGPSCKMHAECFITRARAAAQISDIIVVNHHLFFADFSLRLKNERPDSPVLPKYDAVIFDEAHALEEVATEHFGVTFSEGRVTDLVRDGLEALREHKPDAALAAEHALGALRSHAAALFDRLGPSGAQRRPLTPDAVDGETRLQLARTRQGLDDVSQAFERCGKETPWDSLAARATALARDVDFVFDFSGAAPEGAEPFARLLEERARTRAARALPLTIADLLANTLFCDAPALVLTSATLSLGQSFELFRARMGIGTAAEMTLPSPFDYPRQALVYVPKVFPEPSAPEFATALTEALARLCLAARGGAFLLFTSHRMLRLQAEALKPRLPFLTLVQGEAPKRVLIERFVADGSAVLLASQAFWEGVDVPGQALRLVAIDKLPFGAPDDPLLAARIAQSERQGQRAFEVHQLAAAILGLRQGFGRLIRTSEDHGTVAIFDVRLRRRAYGRKFLNALPPAPVTGDFADVAAFYARRFAEDDAPLTPSAAPAR